MLLVMTNKKRRWIDEESIAWIITWVKAEVDSGGVDPVEHDGDPLTGIWWDFRDDSWVAQRTSEDDEKKVARRGPVVKRVRTPGDPCFGLPKEDAKKVVHKELSDWPNEQT